MTATLAKPREIPYNKGNSPAPGRPSPAGGGVKEWTPLKIQESAENYLEAILVLTRRLGQARSVDVAGYLGFSKPSVSVAVKQLRENGYLRVEADGTLTLLPPGREIAEKIYERHCVIAGMLTALGVDEETALQDACRIEHVISEESFRHIRAHFEAHRQA